MKKFVDLSVRSKEKELLDNCSLSNPELELVLKDIHRVNTLLGGTRITKNALVELFAKNPQNQYTIVDVGCGDGSMLRELAQMCHNMNIRALFSGFDINPQSIQIAREKSSKFSEIVFFEKDILTVQESDLSYDILLCTLTMHHFSEDEIPVFLKTFTQLTRIGVIINDLHRSSLAYYLFQLFSIIFIHTPMAKYDGLVSIKRGFKKQELLKYAMNFPNLKHNIQWRWAFRFLWIMNGKAIIK